MRPLGQLKIPVCTGAITGIKARSQGRLQFSEALTMGAATASEAAVPEGAVAVGAGPEAVVTAGAVTEEATAEGPGPARPIAVGVIAGGPVAVGGVAALAVNNGLAERLVKAGCSACDAVTTAAPGTTLFFGGSGCCANCLGSHSVAVLLPAVWGLNGLLPAVSLAASWRLAICWAAAMALSTAVPGSMPDASAITVPGGSGVLCLTAWLGAVTVCVGSLA